MFDHKHYVPILRWKYSEKHALKFTKPEDKERITPLIELVPPPKPPKTKVKKANPPKQKTIADVMQNAPKEIADFWGVDNIFVDLHLLGLEAAIGGMEKIFDDTRVLGLKIIPVLRINSTKEIQSISRSIIKKDNRGYCLRLFQSDLDLPNFYEALTSFVALMKITEKSVDIIVDLGISHVDHDFNAVLEMFADSLPKWRTFTITSGAFPVDLSEGFELGVNYRPRIDWKNWLDQVRSKKVKRCPTFSDYTIQHPIYRELDFVGSVSRSVRYTSTEQWLVMRGQSDKAEGSARSAQYPAHAQLLANMTEYCGENLCHGDKYIWDKGRDLKTDKTGGAREWLLAGINHHLKFVVDQIASLS